MTSTMFLDLEKKKKKIECNMSAHCILNTKLVSYHSQNRIGGRQGQGRENLLANEKYIYGAEIEIVVEWEGCKTVVRRVLPSVEL